MNTIPIKPIRCPRCKSKSSVVTLSEYHLTEAQYFVIDGYAREECADAAEASIVGNIKATCECGHEWKIKGTSRITDVDAE